MAGSLWGNQFGIFWAYKSDTLLLDLYFCHLEKFKNIFVPLM